MVAEAMLERRERGLSPAGEGWFVVKVSAGAWVTRLGLSLGSVVAVLCVAATSAGAAVARSTNVPAPPAVVRTMRHYLKTRFVQGDGYLGPASATCVRVKPGRYDCMWLVGPAGPGGYRFEYGGKAEVIAHGAGLRVTHVVIQCSPDGLHDVCPGPPLTNGDVHR
jgi:hypothetical protein